MAGGDLEASERPFRRRAGRKVILAVLVGIACVGVVAGKLRSGGDAPPASQDTFYVVPDPLPAGRPGTVLRSREITDPPAGTRGWRLIYISRSHTGRRTALSAVVIVPSGAPATSHGRNVVAFAHPVLGVATRCAPSLDRGYWPTIPGLARFLRAGNAVVVPDYEGLGTAGTHPLFAGRAHGRATLDAVRAANRFEPAGASTRFVAWGTSQGGHSALFAGQEADGYAPELELAGVAAAAPASDLGSLFDVNQTTIPGRILAAYLLSSWARVEPQVRPGRILAPDARAAAARLAALCIPVDSGTIDENAAKIAADVSFAAKRPFRTQPLRGLLARNSAGATSITAPILITQGTRDQLVRPALARSFIRRLCSRGARVQYRLSRGVAHRDIGQKTGPYAANWIADRFAGRAARTTC